MGRGRVHGMVVGSRLGRPWFEKSARGFVHRPGWMGGYAS